MENILIACDYKELNKYSPVLNLSSMQNYIWVKIPKRLCKNILYEIHDLSNPKSREVNFYGKVYKEEDNPWIRIPLDILDVKSGKHTYKLIFMDERSGEFTNTFISYNLQDDNPETPYVYMDNRGNPSHEDNKWKDGQYSEEYFKKMREQILLDYGYDIFRQ